MSANEFAFLLQIGLFLGALVLLCVILMVKNAMASNKQESAQKAWDKANQERTRKGLPRKVASQYAQDDSTFGPQ